MAYAHLDGSHLGIHDNIRKPSSEWRFHNDLYAGRPAAGAVLHGHSPFATSLGCLRREIQALHYMIACFGSDGVRCADYITFDTQQQLSDAVLFALHERNACLLSNHGMLLPRPRPSTGPSSALNLTPVRTVLPRQPAGLADTAGGGRNGDRTGKIR